MATLNALSGYAPGVADVDIVPPGLEELYRHYSGRPAHDRILPHFRPRPHRNAYPQTKSLAACWPRSSWSAFAMALTFAGSAPTGTLGVDMLTVSVTSMTTLAVYLIPLLALLMSFDAISGEADQGIARPSPVLPRQPRRNPAGQGTCPPSRTYRSPASIGLRPCRSSRSRIGRRKPRKPHAALARLMATSVLLGRRLHRLGIPRLGSLAGSSAAAAGLAAAIWLDLRRSLRSRAPCQRRDEWRRHLHPATSFPGS